MIDRVRYVFVGWLLVGLSGTGGTVPAMAVDGSVVATGDPPVSGGYSDAELEVEVENALIYASGVSRTGIEVEVRNGVVTLTGAVDSQESRATAAAAAMSAGAVGVRNMLRVEPR